MKLLIFSDIHFEFHKDGGKEFLNSIVTTSNNEIDYDVAIIAGDISDSKNLKNSLKLLSNSLKEVVFVNGNHEYYDSSFEDVNNLVIETCEKYKNLHFLNNSSIEILGQRFVGGTMWFPFDGMNELFTRGMTDFHVIKSFRENVYKQNESTVKYLYDSICENDIVVTHHLPSNNSIASQYKNHPLNRFFLCNMEQLIKKIQPKLWVHGHTHSSLNYNLGKTRIVCNPFGYSNYEENPNFNWNFVLEI